MKIIALILTLLAVPAQAAVNLYLAPIGLANPTVSPGGTLTIQVTIGSTTEQLAGVDWLLSGPVTVLSRDLTGSSFSDPLATDPTVAGIDLGASINDVTAPLSPGFYSLGTYLLRVNANAMPGQAIIAASGIAPGAGWSGPTYTNGVLTGFSDNGFDAGGTMAFTVGASLAPEPNLFGAALLAVWGFVITRRVK